MATRIKGGRIEREGKIAGAGLEGVLEKRRYM